MTTDLILIRMKSFITEAGVLVLVGVIGIISSDAFAALMVAHFGELWGGGVGVLIVSGIVKHLMNLRALQKYQDYIGGEKDVAPQPLILI